VTALNSSGGTYTGYTGTVHFTSSDTQAGLPADYTFLPGDNGVHTFSVTLKSAGSQTITATDRSAGSITGSATVSVSAASARQLVFGQQPGSTAPGAVISPAVTVRVLDAYGNLVSSDSSDQVTLALGANPGGGTLGGTTTVTVSGGVATFSNLIISKPGNGYTLIASSGSLTGATSAAFNIATGGNLIDGFENAENWNVTGFGDVNAFLSPSAAHDGSLGLDMQSGNDWMYRSDAAAQVKAGDTLSVWLQFSGSADGRAYFGFGASGGGTLSLVAAPNTGQLMLQKNIGYGFTALAAVNQSYLANHWYRLEVDWGTSGTIVGKLFDSNGTTLLGSVTAKTTSILSGGIAFRAIGSDKFFDTVTDTAGVNSFALSASSAAGSQSAGDSRLGEEASLGLWQAVSGWSTAGGWSTVFSSGESGTGSSGTGSTQPATPPGRVEGHTQTSHTRTTGHHHHAAGTSTSSTHEEAEGLEGGEELR
jgi:hypothetical protein